MNNHIRLLILTQYFPPEIGAPQSRLSELAQELTKYGFNVSVLTAMPNYPSGKIHPGYGGFFKKGSMGEVNVYHSYVYPTQSINFFRRMANYISFVISSFIVGLFLRKPHIIFTESPPLFLGISGFLLSRVKQSKWILNIADLWPSSAVELGIIERKSSLFRMSDRLECFLYNHADLVTGQSKSILKNITDRYSKIRTYHLSNGVNSDRFQPIIKNHNTKIKIMYAGLHGLAQGLDQIIQASIILSSNDSIEFIFIGDGPVKTQLIDQAQHSGIQNVTFLDPIPSSQIPAALLAADILLVPLKVQLTGAVPSKLYEGMAAGKPIILIAESEAAEILNNAECGISVKPGDTNGLVSAILRLASDEEERNRLGSNGRKAAIENYDRRKIAQKFANFLLTLD